MTAFRPILARIRDHLSAHWMHHLLLWGILACLLSFVLGFGTGAATVYLVHGGYHRGPLPPRLSVSRAAGGAIPSSASLVPFIARIHNQGNSNSCVGQTVSTITEITTAERRATQGKIGKTWFSAGYVYDQINGGHDAGATYDDAFAVLRVQGDARYHIFPHDGIDWWTPPSLLAQQDAAQHRLATWRSISTSDRYTISYEIAHGRPVAIAIPVTDSFYNLWLQSSVPTVTGQDGAFHFYHSITGVAYDPSGLTIVNSWGPRYGHHGLVRLSWSYIASYATAVVVSQPIQPINSIPTPAPKRTPTPAPKATPTPARTPTRTATPGMKILTTTATTRTTPAPTHTTTPRPTRTATPRPTLQPPPPPPPPAAATPPLPSTGGAAHRKRHHRRHQHMWWPYPLPTRIGPKIPTPIGPVGP